MAGWTTLISTAALTAQTLATPAAWTPAPILPQRAADAQRVPCRGTVRVGFVAGDATVAIQAALESNACEVVLANIGEPWISGPLFINRDGVTLRLEAGAELRAKFGAYPNQGDALIRVRDASSIAILGGDGSRITMLNGVDPDYLDGEWRHAISILDGRSIRVAGLSIESSGGDGVFINGNWLAGDDHIPARNVLIEDCTFIDHRRQGVSVISVEGLVVRRCTFRDIGATSGTDPMAGIDFEPDLPHHRLIGCVVQDCVFIDNRAGLYSSGVHTYLGNLDDTSTPVDILIERCRFTSTIAAGNAVALSGPPEAGPPTVLELRDSVIENVRGSGLYIRSSAANTTVTVADTVLDTVHTDSPAWGGTPIYLEGQSPWIDTYGNIELRNVTIIDDRPRPFLRVYEDRGHLSLPPTRCVGLTGSVTVINPNPAGYEFDLGLENDSGVTLEVTGRAP